MLDDPLSALDVTTEAAVTGRLREVLTGTTTLVVAHRPSTVALADRVAVLEDGRITAVGRTPTCWPRIRTTATCITASRTLRRLATWIPTVDAAQTDELAEVRP